MTNVTEIPQEFKDFLQFCEEQPKSRPIDHTMSWEECAVGDYQESRGLSREDLWGAAHGIFYWNDALLSFAGNACYYPETSTYGGFVEGMKKIVNW